MRRIPYYRLPQNTQKPREPKAQEETVAQVEESAKPVVQIQKEGHDTIFPTFIPLLLTLFLIKNRGYHSRTQQYDGTRGNRAFVQSLANNPKLIDLLNAICPYLSEHEQIPIHTMVGLLKTLDTVRTLQNRTYRIQGLSSQSNLPLHERQLGIIRAMKQYVEPEEGKKNLERLEKLLSMTDQMKNSANRIRALRQNKEQNHASDQIAEMMNIIKPLLPEQQQKNLEKFAKITKLIEVMDSYEESSQVESQKAPENTEDQIPILPEKVANNGTEKIAQPRESDHSGSLSKAQQEKIINALKPLLSDEQQKSMDKLLEIAQGLAKQINSN